MTKERGEPCGFGGRTFQAERTMSIETLRQAGVGPSEDNKASVAGAEGVR